MRGASRAAFVAAAGVPGGGRVRVQSTSPLPSGAPAASTTVAAAVTHCRGGTATAAAAVTAERSGRGRGGRSGVAAWSVQTPPAFLLCMYREAPPARGLRFRDGDRARRARGTRARTTARRASSTVATAPVQPPPTLVAHRGRLSFLPSPVVCGRLLFANSACDRRRRKGRGVRTHLAQVGCGCLKEGGRRTDHGQ